MTVEELQVVIEAETRQFRQEINRVQRDVNSMTSNVNKQVNKIKNIFGGVGKLVAGIGIGKIFKDSIISAMDAIEGESLFGTVFGSLSDEVRQWSEELRNELGLNDYAIRKNAATLFEMTKNMGLSKSSALDLSKNMTLLAEDMASFYNLSSDEAFNKLRAGITGETEPLKQLGILVDENTIKAYAYANGIAEEGRQLTNTEKVMARYGAIMQQTSTAQGDLARTIDSPANQLRLLQTELKLTMINLGQAFMPIVQFVLPLLTSLVKGINTVISAIGRFNAVLFGKKSKTESGAAGVTKKATNVQAGYNNELAKTGSTAKKTANEMKGFLAGFDEINSLNQNSANGPDGGESSGAGQFDDVPGIDFDIDTDSAEESFGKIEQFAQKIRDLFSNVAKFIKEHSVIITSVIAGVVAGIISFFLISNWGVVASTIGAVIGWIGLIPTALGLAWLAITSPAALVSLAIGAVVAAIVYLWQTSESFRESVMTVVKGVMDILSRLWNEILVPLGSFLIDILVTALKPIGTFFAITLVRAVEAAFKILESLWVNILQPIANFLIDILASALKGIIEIWNAWKPTIEGIFNVLLWLWDSMLKPLCDFVVGAFSKVFESWGAKIKDVIETVKKIFNGLVDFIVGVFTGNWSRAWEGVKNVFGGIFEGIYRLAVSPINGIINLVNALIRGLNKIKLPDWVPGLGGKGINIPEIPKLARGGIVDGATNFGNYIAGEAGKEMIVPLENTSFVNTLASSLGTAVLNAMNMSNSLKGDGKQQGDIKLVLDGSVVGRLLNPYIKKDNMRLGNNLITIG